MEILYVTGIFDPLIRSNDHASSGTWVHPRMHAWMLFEGRCQTRPNNTRTRPCNTTNDHCFPGPVRGILVSHYLDTCTSWHRNFQSDLDSLYKEDRANGADLSMTRGGRARGKLASLPFYLCRSCTSSHAMSVLLAEEHQFWSEEAL